MDIIYIDYAKDTIKDRNINKEDIEKAILNPHEIIEGKKGRKIAHKILGNKLLRVVFEQEAKTYIVITAYYARPKRYIKNENKF